MQTLKLLLVAMATAMALDAIWMGLIAGGLYKQQLGSLLRLSKDLQANHWVAIVLIYVALASGVVFFVLPKAATIGQAGLYGAGFGLVLYGLYELTNYALVSGWAASIVVVDTLWGAIICGLASVAAYFVSRA